MMMKNGKFQEKYLQFNQNIEENCSEEEKKKFYKNRKMHGKVIDPRILQFRRQ